MHIYVFATIYNIKYDALILLPYIYIYIDRYTNVYFSSNVSTNIYLAETNRSCIYYGATV